MTTGIIDYGGGNLYSVVNALNYLERPAQLIKNPEDMQNIQKLIFPGVGSFAAAVNDLKKRELFKPIQAWIESNRPYLGICLGMQLLFARSSESPEARGFGVLSGRVEKFRAKRIPQIGWNRVKGVRENYLSSRLQGEPFFYFLHSYHVSEEQGSAPWTLGLAEYEGITYPAAVHLENIWGVQFHPEKSGQVGLQLLKNWLDWDGDIVVNCKNYSLPGC